MNVKPLQIFILLFLALTASTYFTTVITLERFVVVHWPLRARSICTVSTARITSVLVCVFSLLYAAPEYFAVYAEKLPTSGEMQQRYKVEPTAFGRSYQYQVVYLSFLFMTFSYMVPFITLIVLNLAIYFKVHFTKYHLFTKV